MRHDALDALRDALLLALGLAACGTRQPPDQPPAPDLAPQLAPAAPPRSLQTPGQTGFVREADGLVHRASPRTCDPDVPRRACTSGKKYLTSCATDDQCTDRPHGLCAQQHGDRGSFCACSYSCASDDDCQPDEMCVCSDVLGAGHRSTCVQARCKQDSECDGVCGLIDYDDGCGRHLMFTCVGIGDGCSVASDCADNEFCAFDEETEKRACMQIRCVPGRPLVVAGELRTAATVPRGDWSAPIDLPALAPSLAAALAAHWSAIAALEHASVASFARFTLELMALGAPPDLLIAAQHAALDEIQHARLAWSLAAHWAGHGLGPGPLATADLGPARDLETFVAALVHEGCVGETLGAAEARSLAEQAHPALASRLAAVADDETRHAALAWRTLAWLHATFGEPVRLAALAAVSTSAAALAVARPQSSLVAPSWGAPGDARLQQQRNAAFAAVVRPLLAATLGSGLPTFHEPRSLR